MNSPTDLLLAVVAVGIVGVFLLMLVLVLVAMYGGRLIGRIEAPVKTLGEKVDTLTHALEDFTRAATGELGDLRTRVGALESRAGV